MSEKMKRNMNMTTKPIIVNNQKTIGNDLQYLIGLSILRIY